MAKTRKSNLDDAFIRRMRATALLAGKAEGAGERRKRDSGGSAAAETDNRSAKANRVRRTVKR